LNYNRTRIACFIGYITQAIVLNFPPLLFVLFHERFGIALDQIGFLVTICFVVQLSVDLACSALAEHIRYKPFVLAAHLSCGAGLVLLGVLPGLMANKFLSLLIPTFFYAVGGGLIEVIISPVIEACPSENKSGQMSLLHSFYCWGQAGVVLLSTAAFAVLGMEIWPYIACFWAIVPLGNVVLFTFSPVPELKPEGGAVGVKKLVSMRIFWVLLLMMICAGASELAMSQWASAFAETGLGVSKMMGDLLGPCLFALMMGLSRLGYAWISEKRGDLLEKIMVVLAVTCVLGYLMAAKCPGSALPLLGCALVGFSVGIFWPGTFSVAAMRCPSGGTAMFALLALGGDIGCSIGPYLVGAASAAAGDTLSAGLLASVVFPAVLFLTVLYLRTIKKDR